MTHSKEGEKVCNTTNYGAISDKITSFLGLGEEPVAHPLVLEKKEFEPTMFQLCADNNTVNTSFFFFDLMF